MSVEAIAIALHHSRATGTAKVVILGIANHAGDGGSWPSVATLASYANVDPRRVQVAVRKLEDLGEVRREIQAGGTAWTNDHKRPNLYHFTLTCPIDCDRSMNHRRVRVTKTSPGDESVTGAGDENVTRTIPVNRTTTTDPETPYVSSHSSKAGEAQKHRATHVHEPNARRALTDLAADRALPIGVDELLDHAYRLGGGDPWAGYVLVKDRTAASLDGTRDPAAALRARLRDSTKAA